MTSGNNEILLKMLEDCLAVSNTLPNKTLGREIHAQVNNIISLLTDRFIMKTTPEEQELLIKALKIAGSKKELAWHINVNTSTLLTWQKGTRKPMGGMMDSLKAYVAGNRRAPRKIVKG